MIEIKNISKTFKNNKVLDLYQTPGFGDTTNFAAIKKHYHIDCCPSNEFAIVPNGPDESLWLTPHGREKLSGK